MNHQETTPTVQGVPEPVGEILTKEELARRWKVSFSTIERLAYDRVSGVRHFRIGRQVRFRLRDVEDFEKKNLTHLRMF
jgi:excisionase family DNA binding protein